MVSLVRSYNTEECVLRRVSSDVDRGMNEILYLRTRRILEKSTVNDCPTVQKDLHTMSNA